MQRSWGPAVPELVGWLIPMGAYIVWHVEHVEHVSKKMQYQFSFMVHDVGSVAWAMLEFISVSWFMVSVQLHGLCWNSVQCHGLFEAPKMAQYHSIQIHVFVFGSVHTGSRMLHEDGSVEAKVPY